MPSFVSEGGVWKPAHERVFNPDTNEMYDGPDREALKILEKEGNLGQDASKDPQLLQASRNAGFNSVQEYLAYFAPKPADVEANKVAKEAVVTHAAPKPKPGVNPSKGGFHDDNTSPMTAMEKKEKA